MPTSLRSATIGRPEAPSPWSVYLLARSSRSRHGLICLDHPPTLPANCAPDTPATRRRNGGATRDRCRRLQLRDNDDNDENDDDSPATAPRGLRLRDHGRDRSELGPWP